MPQIFVSYRRKDSSTTTGRLIDRLKARFPHVDIFHDVKSIPAGTDFKEYTNQNVSSNDIFLIIIGPLWLDILHERLDGEDFVRDELELSLAKNCKTLPIYVNNATPPSAQDLPEHLSSLAYINGLPLRNDPDFENDLVRIKQFLKEEIALRTGIFEKAILRLKTFDTKLLFSFIGLIAFLVLIGSHLLSNKFECDGSKIQTIVANFSEKVTDGFTNTLVVKLDKTLPDSIFNVKSCDFQDRNVDNYNKTIKSTFFEPCQAKGLFINGFRDESQKVFNFYANNVGLKLNAPEYMTDNAIVLTELKEATFSAQEDSKLIHDYVALWLSYYLDDSKTFIKNNFQFQKDHNLTQKSISKQIKLSSSMLGSVYLMLADHYSIEGNEKRAHQYYDQAAQVGNPTVKVIAKENKEKAQRIADIMYMDSELRKLRAENYLAHGRIENGFEKFIKELGKVFEKIFNSFGIR